MLSLASRALTAPALFFAGGAASAHCALMCGSLAIHHARSAPGIAPRQALAWLHGGRVAGYAAMGVAAGLLGQGLLLHLASARFGYWLQVGAAVALLASGIWIGFLKPAGHAHHCAPPRVGLRLPAQLNLLLRGLSWALLPCALLYAVLLLAAFTASALQGGLLAAAFALGGTPVLATLGWRFRVHGAQRASARRTGLWMMLLAVIGLLSLNWSGAAGALAFCAEKLAL